MARPSVKAQILDAGFQTLQLRGFNATSVQDITEAAGVPKGSFYNHFDSKEALGIEVLRRYAAEAGQRLAVLDERELPPLVRLRRYFEGLMELVGSRDYQCGCMLGTLGGELANQSAPVREEVGRLFDGWIAAIAAVLAETGHPDPPRLARHLIASWQGALLLAKVRQHGEPLQDFLDVTFHHTLR